MISGGLIPVVALLASAGAALASPLTFATFSQSGGNSPLSFTNNGVNPGTGTLSASAQVIFDFTSGTGLSSNDRAATLTLIGTTFDKASTFGTLVDQPIGQISHLSIVENATGNILLSLGFTGDIVGRVGSSTATLAGSDTTGNTVVFSSGFVVFGPQPGNSYSLTLASLSGPLSTNANSLLNSFSSGISGSFTANVIPVTASPEPATWTLFVTAAAWTVLRRRSL